MMAKSIKNIFIGVLLFVIGFLVGGGMGINYTLNTGFDSIVDSLKNEMPSVNVDGLKKNMQDKVNEKKEEFIKELNKRKEEIIAKIKQDMKKKVNEQIDNLFK